MMEHLETVEKFQTEEKYHPHCLHMLMLYFLDSYLQKAHHDKILFSYFSYIKTVVLPVH